METTLKDIWNNVKDIGYNTKINNLNIQTKWKELKHKYYIYVLSDTQKMKISDKLKNLIILQSANNFINVDSIFVDDFKSLINNNFKLSVLELLKFAYIAGQYLAIIQTSTLTSTQITDQYCLTNPETYVDCKYLDYFIMTMTTDTINTNDSGSEQVTTNIKNNNNANEFKAVANVNKINRKTLQTELYFDKYKKYKRKYSVLKKARK